MIFKIYNCDFGVKVDGVSYDFPDVAQLVIRGSGKKQTGPRLQREKQTRPTLQRRHQRAEKMDGRHFEHVGRSQGIV
jgi:hypothetical protein